MKDDYQNSTLKLLPCQTAEEVKALLEVNDKGQVKNTMQNVYTVFACDPVLHGSIGYNILTGRIDICKPLWWDRTASAMNDTDFNYLMPEDTKVGVIQAFLDDFDGNMVCSKLLHHEALGRFDEPKAWEIREINEIMNQSVTGWTPYPNPRSYRKYGKQRGWMRGNKIPETGTDSATGFRELSEAECRQEEIPF